MLQTRPEKGFCVLRCVSQTTGPGRVCEAGPAAARDCRGRRARKGEPAVRHIIWRSRRPVIPARPLSASPRPPAGHARTPPSPRRTRSPAPCCGAAGPSLSGSAAPHGAAGSWATAAQQSRRQEEASQEEALRRRSLLRTAEPAVTAVRRGDMRRARAAPRARRGDPGYACGERRPLPASDAAVPPKCRPGSTMRHFH